MNKYVEKVSTEKDLELIFVSLFRQLPFPVSLATLPSGIFVEVSDAWVQFFGIQRNEAVGKNSVELGLNLNPALRETIFSELQKSRASHRKEFEFIACDGKNKFCVVDVDLVRIGSQDYIHSVIQDISDRKQYEQALIESESKASVILEASPVPLGIVDMEGHITFLNNSFVNLFGYSTKEIPTLNDWLICAYPDENYRKWALEKWQSNFQLAKDTGESFKPIEVNISCKNTSIKTIIVGVEILHVGNKEYLLTSFFDISHQKAALEQLNKSETFLRLSQTVGGIGSWEVDLINNIQKWSENCISLLGFPQINNPTWEDFLALVYPDDRQLVIDATQDHLDHGTKYDVEFRVINKSGDIRWMRSAGQAECDQIGNPIRMRGIGQDITQQKLMRDVLKKSEELYRNTFQTSLDAININRMNDGVYINVNEAFLKTLGYARDEVIGRSSLDLNIWADNSDRKHLVEILLRNSVCPNIEARFRCKNGNIIWGLMSASIIIVDNEPCILSITRDITERKFAEEQLRLWGDSFEKAEFGLAMADATTNEFVYVNPTFARERGYSRDELVGKPIMTVFPYQVHDQINSMISELDVATHITYESVHICKDGRQFPVLLDITNIKSEAGVPTRRIAYAMDITQRKKLEENQRISAIAFESQDGIFITDANGLILSVNRSFTRITGYLPNDVTGKNPRILSSGRQNIDFYVAMWKSINTLGYWEGEIWNKRKNGEIYPEYLTIKAVKDGQEVVTNYVASLTDISRRIEAEKQVQNLAHFDQLTGLPNRTLLNEHFQYALSFSQRSNGPLAVLFLDLDHFKDINDTLGHSIGDLILMEAARRLKTILREQDTLSRQGGDEFILILPGSDADGAALVASKLIDVVSQPCVIEQHELIITPSIGIAIYPNDGETLELLSKNADAAMYRAKHSGRNNFRFFTPEMQAQSSRNLTLANALRHAIERNEMQLHYQPQLSIQDGHIIGVEALLRWQNSELGNISPTEFIPIAENNGQIIKIGEWVLSTAVRQLKHWIDIGYSPLIMAVNLSAVQFRQNNLPELVTRILEAEKLPPQYLELELTEAAAMDNPQAAIEMMNRLNELGIRMSIDDFGTGYSSLSYLKKFKVYKLKIDQSFVRDLTEDPEDKAIVTAIINMANGLGLQTIAEGVETSNQLAFLRLQGCNEVQGYYFSKPLAPSQFEEFVREYLMSR